jgi:hypothetical protein
LRIAEKNPDLADGVIAMGAFIDLENESKDSYLVARPKIPAILMSNTTEIEGPLEYAVLADAAEVQPSLRPLLRPGHVNVNGVERLAAVRAMMATLQNGEPMGLKNGTREMPPRNTGTVVVGDSLVNEVTSINPYYGNAFLGFDADEFINFGIAPNTYFEVAVHDASFKVLFGRSYGDVPEGDWVAFPHANDHILLVRNHKRAVDTAGLKVGDLVSVRPYESGPANVD